MSQTSQALRAAARALPAAVWRQSRERTMPGYHPLSGAQDVWAAADSLWRGCASLVHGETYAGTISADSDLTAATLLQVPAVCLIKCKLWLRAASGRHGSG